jgi:hypothetical protein
MGSVFFSIESNDSRIALVGMLRSVRARKFRDPSWTVDFSPVFRLFNRGNHARDPNCRVRKLLQGFRHSCPVILVFNRGNRHVHSNDRVIKLLTLKSSRLFFACLTGETDWPGAMVALVVGARGARLVPLKGAAA